MWGRRKLNNDELLKIYVALKASTMVWPNATAEEIAKARDSVQAQVLHNRELLLKQLQKDWKITVIFLHGLLLALIPLIIVLGRYLWPDFNALPFLGVAAFLTGGLVLVLFERFKILLWYYILLEIGVILSYILKLLH